MNNTDKNIIEIMREVLQPKGTAPLVILHLGRSIAAFDKSFVDDCIDDLERKSIQVAAGLDTFSPLDRLAFEVLKESAGVEHALKLKNNS